ncbi:MAG: PAS domain S-box protein [Acidimicrobiia bacterium]|nr:PAS domain S-box protein [Acidimicrobiia bacterium]
MVKQGFRAAAEWDVLSTPAREELYRQIVESAHEGIWVTDGRGRTVFVNGRMASMLGYAPAQMIGHALDEFTVERAPLARALADRATWSREVRLTARDGTVVWSLMNSSPLHNEDGDVSGVLTMVADISTRKAAEEALRDSERRLKTIFETEPACVKLVSADGRLLEMNPAGLQMIDADDLSQVIGQEIVNLVHPADRDRFRETIRAASAGEPARAEFRIIGLRGTQRWLETHAVPFDPATAEKGQPSVVLGVTQDVTQRKLLEYELNQAQKLEAVGRLAGGIAHDFNNLLTAILGYADFAAMQLPPKHPVHGELAQIREAGERAVALTAQLLAFSRNQILRPRVMDINETVTGLLKMLPRIIGEHIATSAELDTGLHRVKADPTQLEQVLLNLALNARDAMPDGGALIIRTANVVLQEPPADDPTFQPGPFVRLSVTDTGTGMDTETEARAFEPFFTTKDVGRGTGLGLSTVYGIVTQSRGYISVATEMGRGTTITIHLPATSEPIERGPVAQEVQLRGGRETVLLVEDAEAVRELERRTLETSGYRVLVARDGVEAIGIAVQEEGQIDLLVTDVVMPHLTGPQLAAELTVRWPSIRTLYVSGFSEQIPPREAGGHRPRLLKKPFTPARLVDVVRSVLDEVEK